MGSQHHLQGVRTKYAFIKAHRGESGSATICRLLAVSRSGFSESEPVKRAISPTRGSSITLSSSTIANAAITIWVA